MKPAHFKPKDVLDRINEQPTERSIALLKVNGLRIKMYAPRGHDPQTPHTRDEIYVVARGSGIFSNGESRKEFAIGDLLFVEAGIPHRFENFTDDFATWVIYGSETGHT